MPDGDSLTPFLAWTSLVAEHRMPALDRSMRRWRSWDIFTLGMVVAATVWVWKTASGNKDLQAALRMSSREAERLRVQDRLVGGQVDLSFLEDTLAVTGDPRSNQDSHLLWIVDLERCPTCLGGGFAIWNELSKDPLLNRHLLVVGVREGAIPGHARRALTGTAIAFLSREQVEESFGSLSVPNTKMLTDGEGTVLMADARPVTSECGWSFEAQIGALRGVLGTRAIRYQPLIEENRE